MTTTVEKESKNNLLLGNISHNKLKIIKKEFLYYIKKIKK